MTIDHLSPGLLKYILHNNKEEEGVWTICFPLIGSNIGSFILHQPVMEDHHTTWFTNGPQNTAIGGTKKYKHK